MDIVIQSGHSKDLLASRLTCDFTHEPSSADFGMRMNSALSVDLEKTERDYIQFHQHWEQEVEKQKSIIHKYAPTLVFSNVPYLTIAAAAELTIPALALCSLNWAHIFRPYFHETAQHDSIYQQMLASYNKAEAFLCPQPSMAMPGLTNVKSVGPLALSGTSQRKALLKKLEKDAATKIVLIVPGGIATTIELDQWPQSKNIVWVPTWDYESSRTDIVNYKKLDMNFSNLLASSDAVISKPGYGMVAESVCNQIPMLYTKRGDWPEESALVSWLEEHGQVREITQKQFFSGEVLADLDELWGAMSKDRINPTGIEETVGEILLLYI